MGYYYDNDRKRGCIVIDPRETEKDDSLLVVYESKDYSSGTSFNYKVTENLPIIKLLKNEQNLGDLWIDEVYVENNLEPLEMPKVPILIGEVT